jgi:S1-C subfamily serine protease
VLAAAALGSGITYALSSGSSSVPPPSPLPVPAANSVSQPSGQMNVSKIASEVEPAVVDITSTLAFGQGTAAGTGMVVTPSGEVITNNHVVEGASRVSVTLSGHPGSYRARVVGTDAKADVAVLQIVGVSGLPTVRLGNSSTVAVGEPVVAIGNALDLPGGPSVTEGTISGLDRSVTAGDPTGSTEHLTGMLQTDAPISSGDSGGPLLNADAQVIGMDTAAASSGSGATVSNVAFAIPINTVVQVADQIVAGHGGSGVVIGQPGFLGVEVTSVSAANSGAGGGLGGGFGGFGGGLGGGFGGFGGEAVAPVSSGALVVQVISGYPAERAGIVAGDVITGFDGKTVSSPSDLSQVIAGTHPGDKATVRWVGPSGNTHQATVTLANGPIP